MGNMAIATAGEQKMTSSYRLNMRNVIENYLPQTINQSLMLRELTFKDYHIRHICHYMFALALISA